MMILPQLRMLTGCGATKSFTSAGKEAEERLFRNVLPKASQVPAGKTPDEVRLIAASPKVPAGRLTFAIGSVTVTALAEKHWLVAPLVTHLSKPSTGLPDPPKSKVIRMSPAVRTSAFGPVVVRSGCALWFSSKSMFAEPSTFERSQAR